MGDIFNNIKLKFDDKELETITKKFSNLNKIISSAEANNVSDKTFKKMQKIEDSLKKQALWKEKALNTQKKIDKYYLKQLKQMQKQEKADKFKEQHPYLYKTGKNIDAKVQKLANKLVNFISSIWSGILNNMKEMISEKGVASYNMGTSLFTNAHARQMSMKYGLGAGQTYALDNTMKMLGMSSDEDLMYMNTAQKAKFNELMTKYSAWYDKMEQSGFLQNVQEAQLELKMFKQEVAMKFMNWFAENKDTIMAVINGALKALETIANGVFSVLNLFRTGKNTSTSSALSSEQLNNVTTNNNNLMNINNTVNANVTTNNQADAQNFGRDVANGAIRLYNQALNTL